MNGRSKRIRQWIITAIVALTIFGIGQLVEYIENRPEKQTITVYAPSDMEEAFENALKESLLKKTHKLVMSDDPNSSICVAYGKQGDTSYQKFAFSPFTVAYDSGSSYLKKLTKSGVCQPSAYNDDYYEIDFLKIINEAVGEGKWDNLGIEKQDKIKVFYPAQGSVYWNDFHDFLLVTLNDGRYPQDEAEMQKAEQTINRFVSSEYTYGVSDFQEQVKRTGGFPSTVIYILPEKEARDFCVSDYTARFLFPKNTVYFNYYVKGDEAGKQIIEAFDNSSIWRLEFYDMLSRKYYRTSKFSELKEIGNAYGEGNIYNVVQIPESIDFSTTTASE